MGLHYYHTECSHENCKKTAYREFSNQKEYYKSKEKYNKTGWKCLRHTNPDEVLSKENTTTKITLTVLKTEHGKYWQKDKDKGTDKVDSGFIYGTGFKAYARDFKTGTKIIITTIIEQSV